MWRVIILPALKFDLVANNTLYMFTFMNSYTCPHESYFFRLVLRSYGRVGSNSRGRPAQHSWYLSSVWNSFANCVSLKKYVVSNINDHDPSGILTGPWKWAFLLSLAALYVLASGPWPTMIECKDAEPGEKPVGLASYAPAMLPMNSLMQFLW